MSKKKVDYIPGELVALAKDGDKEMRSLGYKYVGWANVWVKTIKLVPVLFLLAMPALAHDGLHDQWMEQLKQPNGISCCSSQDCFRTVARVGKDGWEAKNLRGDWVKIPEEIIIRDKGNPTGEPFLCYNHGRPLCFVEGPMS